jgi:putative PIN family toxin of toxin-antitoxin system
MGERAVVDTNVLVSAFRGTGAPLDVLMLVASTEVDLIMSYEQVSELRRVLGYARLGLAPEEREENFQFILRNAIVVPIKSIAPIILADPSDDIFLATAEQHAASVIITGDKHLLALGSYKGIPIMTPAIFIFCWRTRTHTD